MPDLQVFLRGGLGNQLFQYAAALYLAKRQGDQLIIRTDLLPLETDSIGKVTRWPVQITEFKFEGQIRNLGYQPKNGTHTISKLLQAQRVLGDKNPMLLSKLGILAGEKHARFDFSAVQKIKTVNSYCTSSAPAVELGDYLRDQILQVREPSFAFQALSKEAVSLKPAMVHVRLGDYVLLKNLFGETNFDLLGEVIKKTLDSARRPLWLFSDSPNAINPQVIDGLGVTKVVGPETLNRPIENLILMSMGSELFCANSTFSWWSAFLKGDKGSVFYSTNTQAPNVIFRDDLILKGWTAV